MWGSPSDTWWSVQADPRRRRTSIHQQWTVRSRCEWRWPDQQNSEQWKLEEVLISCKRWETAVASCFIFVGVFIWGEHVFFCYDFRSSNRNKKNYRKLALQLFKPRGNKFEILCIYLYNFFGMPLKKCVVTSFVNFHTDDKYYESRAVYVQIRFLYLGK